MNEPLTARIEEWVKRNPASLLFSHGKLLREALQALKEHERKVAKLSKWLANTPKAAIERDLER